jgi:hypothetical protein
MALENIENIIAALDAIEGNTARLRSLADTGSKIGDDMTNNVTGMSREEQFNAAMEIWRHFSKIGAAITWLELNARTARRNANSLLSELTEEV